MEDGFVKYTKIIEQTDEEKDIELIRSVIKSKQNLDVARKNYEYAEEDLIDYYTYQIKAEQSKIDYLIKKIKNKQLTLDMINEIKIRLEQKEAI